MARKNVSVYLDDDLALELERKVREDGYDWKFLPVELRLRYLSPLLTRQTVRERRLLEVARGEATRSVG